MEKRQKQRHAWKKRSIISSSSSGSGRRVREQPSEKNAIGQNVTYIHPYRRWNIYTWTYVNRKRLFQRESRVCLERIISWSKLMKPNEWNIHNNRNYHQTFCAHDLFLFLFILFCFKFFLLFVNTHTLTVRLLQQSFEYVEKKKRNTNKFQAISVNFMILLFLFLFLFYWPFLVVLTFHCLLKIDFHSIHIDLARC